MEEAPAGQLYRDLYEILKEKEYFILTTNCDIQIPKAFPEERTCQFQGDFSYFQCSQPCHDKLHANVAGKTVELPTNVDAELLAKVLSNPEMAALLSTLAKSLESK